MTYTETKLKGVWIIEPKVFQDERGYFFEYNPKKSLDEQNVSPLAKSIIAILYEDYWDETLNELKICLIK